MWQQGGHPQNEGGPYRKRAAARAALRKRGGPKGGPQGRQAGPGGPSGRPSGQVAALRAARARPKGGQSRARGRPTGPPSRPDHSVKCAGSSKTGSGDLFLPIFFGVCVKDALFRPPPVALRRLPRLTRLAPPQAERHSSHHLTSPGAADPFADSSFPYLRFGCFPLDSRRFRFDSGFPPQQKLGFPFPFFPPRDLAFSPTDLVFPLEIRLSFPPLASFAGFGEKFSSKGSAAPGEVR